MRRWLVLLALAACEESHDCPAIQEFNGFKLVLDDDAWELARYTVEVSYRDEAGEHAYRCDVSVPADAGLDGYFQCSSLMGEQNPFADAEGKAGKTLVLTFGGTPDEVHLLVRHQGTLVVERDLELDYETTRRFGKHCAGSSTAEVRVDLDS